MDQPIQPAGLDDRVRTSYAVRVATYYGALFLVYGLHMPYLPVWLNAKGLSDQEIAFVTGTPFFIRIFITPTVALICDQRQNHRQLITWLSGAGAIFALALSQMATFPTLLITAVFFAICQSTIMPLVETIAVAGVRGAGLDYGRMRLWGSLTFVGIGYVAGASLDIWGPSAIVVCLVFSALSMVVAAQFLPARDQVAACQRGQGSTVRRLSLKDAAALVHSPLFLVFLLASGAIQGAHGMFYTFGALHWRESGISSLWVGTLWAIGVGCEVLLFAYSGAVISRFGATKLLIIAGVAAVLRWTAMCFDPALPVLIPLQMLHGLTYGAAHLGAMHFISKAMPPSAAGTAQAFYATIAAGILMGGATLLAGQLYGRVGSLGFAAMAAIAAVGLAAAIVLARRWDGGLLKVAG